MYTAHMEPAFIRLAQYPSPQSVTLGEYARLIELVDAGSETRIHAYLEAHPHFWRHFLSTYRTGHHNFVVVSKQQISPHIPGVRHGQIPDFIIGGKNSDGWSWYVIELKSPNQKLFSGSGGKSRLSNIANGGVLQMMAYRNFCGEYQGVMRDLFKLEEFSEPTAVLLIDRARTFELSEEQRRLKRSWNRAATFAEIRTYDSLLSALHLELLTSGVISGSPVRDPENAELEFQSDVRNEIRAVRGRFSEVLYENL